jgi:hypothetical protein
LDVLSQLKDKLEGDAIKALKNKEKVK